MERELRKLKYKKILLSILIITSLGMVMTVGIMLFSKRFDLRGWIDGLFFSGLIIFTFGWMLFITNQNLFTVLFFGIKQFFFGLIGKYKPKDIIDVIQEKKEMPRYLILVTFGIGLLYMTISVLLYLLTK